MADLFSKSRPYDVVLVPEASLSHEAIRLGDTLKERGTYFTLDRTSFYPHLSLYMLQLDEAGLEEALKRLAALETETKPVQASADHYHYSYDYLDVEYAKSEELTALQQKVIEALNPVRDGLRENDKARLETATGEERSNILEYGYRSVGNQFKPHLTFTRFTSDQKEVIPSLPLPQTFDGTYDALGIFEMGEHGTCARLVKAWDLSARH